MKALLTLFFLSLFAFTVNAQQNKFSGGPSAPVFLGSIGGGETRTRVIGDSSAVASAPVASAAIMAVEHNAFDKLNRVRELAGLGDLVWSDEIAAIARLHSANMSSENFFSHRRP